MPIHTFTETTTLGSLNQDALAVLAVAYWHATDGPLEMLESLSPLEAFSHAMEHASIVAEMNGGYVDWSDFNRRVATVHPDGGSRAAGSLLVSEPAGHPDAICDQCGVTWAKHPAGDGLTECAGDFPSSRIVRPAAPPVPCPPQPNESAAVQELRIRITELRLELRRQAEAGDITGCDELHSQIGSLEAAIAILLGER